MKLIYKTILIVGIVVSTLLVGRTNTASAATYLKGCYVSSQGSSYQKVNCPSSSPDDAIRYANGCWVSTASSSASTPFKEFDCTTGGQTDLQKKAACEASGGRWVTDQDRGTTASSCTDCPTGKTSSATVCVNSGTISGTGTGTTGGSSGLSRLNEPLKTGDEPAGVAKCGSGENEIEVSFDFGCLGPAYGKELNPILDIAFALFRFLSAGVGLVVIGSIIIAGIQYSASRGNPQATGAAIKRITNAIIGLLIYIFSFAILNFIVPGGLFI